MFLAGLDEVLHGGKLCQEIDYIFIFMTDLRLALALECGCRTQSPIEEAVAEM